MLSCANCNLTFTSLEELADHKRTAHNKKRHLKSVALAKMREMEDKLSKQIVSFTSSLIKLKNKEQKESRGCHCRSFCRIYHEKHSFVRSRSDQILEELRSLTKFPELCDKTTHNAADIDGHVISHQLERDSIYTGTIVKKYTCDICEEKFSKQGALKKHKKSEHRLREEKIGEVVENSETGGMS